MRWRRTSGTAPPDARADSVDAPPWLRPHCQYQLHRRTHRRAAPRPVRRQQVRVDRALRRRSRRTCAARHSRHHGVSRVDAHGVASERTGQGTASSRVCVVRDRGLAAGVFDFRRARGRSNPVGLRPRRRGAHDRPSGSRGGDAQSRRAVMAGTDDRGRDEASARARRPARRSAETRPGSESRWAPSVATTLTDRAAILNNEM